MFVQFFVQVRILKKESAKNKEEKLGFRNKGSPFALSSKDFFQKIHLVYDSQEFNMFKIDAIMEV